MGKEEKDRWDTSCMYVAYCSGWLDSSEQVEQLRLEVAEVRVQVFVWKSR